jgi:hypothetical protein
MMPVTMGTQAGVPVTVAVGAVEEVDVTVKPNAP